MAASATSSSHVVQANLFVGGLAPDVDERALRETFSRFGGRVVSARVVYDSDTGASRGFGFVHFDDFAVADAAIAALDGQYLGGMPISVNYAYKKGGGGERYGTEAERLLAANARSLGLA